MHTCKHCNKQVGDSHYCEVAKRTITYNEDSDNSGDFLLSAAIGYATDSALLGGLLGGDMVGGIVGEMFHGSSEDSSSPVEDRSSPVEDCSSGNDDSSSDDSSYDSGSDDSYDSGDSGGGSDD